MCVPMISFAEGSEIHIALIDDMWATIKNYLIPICAGLAILGAFIADRYDSEMGKRGLIGVAVILLLVKVSVLAIAAIKTMLAGS
jgi:hypothetical protein